MSTITYYKNSFEKGFGPGSIVPVFRQNGFNLLY